MSKPIPGMPHFTEEVPMMKKRLIVTLSGFEKQGKTHFACTAPDPIAFFSLDNGHDGVIQQFKGKKIYLCRIEVPLPDVVAFDYLKEWNKFREAYMAAMKNPAVKTIIIDTVTEVYDLIRLCRFGKLAGVLAHHYGPVNAEMRSLFRDKPFETDKNFIFLQKMHKQYIKAGDKEIWNGKYEPAGFKDMGHIAQVNLSTRYDEKESCFKLKVVNSRLNMLEVVGQEYDGELATFPMLLEMLTNG